LAQSAKIGAQKIVNYLAAAGNQRRVAEQRDRVSPKHS
jgi:hypothetical protein